ncbi:unnamed protein product [Adineta steineri]|uniref:Integrase catalytic domain-containing protein n=1 Tax=Adineta steineri TaxID=433720 RepID=A0A819TEM8_9BILA|nr:unnamed protein product [Adineta steineri]CAF4064476.1 unnamed protein product [Adineta steineri]
MNDKNEMDIFYSKLQTYIDSLDIKKRNKYTIKNDMCLDILSVLKEENNNVSAKFKFWAKQTFRLVKIGSTDFVYVKKNNLPLVTHEQIYYRVVDCHVAVGHSGRDKTWAEIKRLYAGIPHQAICIYINMCDTCQTRRSFPTPISGKPIVSLGFLTRLQVDLIDMRSVSYNIYNFIMHAKDHFTKFSWLYALPSKEAINVANNLRNIFYTFGLPKILQSDNGKEFVAKIILDLKLNWPDLIIINGRPRHPQSQGLVERSNAVVQHMIGKWLEKNKTSNWPDALGPVMLAINNSISQSTKKSPYEMVFGQTLRIDHDFWEEIQKQSKNCIIINEEEIDESIINEFDLFNEPLATKNSTCIDISSPISNLLSNVSDTECADKSCQNTAHKRIRKEAEICYLRTADAIKQRLYQINDIVGLKIASVDRSNMAPSILPCRVIQVLANEESLNTTYKVATLYGVISNSFSSSDFTNLSQTVSAELRQLDIKTLSSISFIQACQKLTHYKSNQVCKCVGTCDTNRCPCKKQSIKCCSKCHRGKCTLCENYI